MKESIKLMVMLLFAVTMATMSSCSKEDNYQKRIVGKWVQTSCKKLGYLHGEVVSTDDYTTNIIIEFKSDGTMTVGGMVEYQYTLNGDSLEFDNYRKKIVELTTSTMVLEETEHYGTGPAEYWISRTEFVKK